MNIRRGAWVLIFFLPIFALFFVPNSAAAITIDATGTGCAAFGNWDAATKTCTQTRDVSGIHIQITAPGITFDGGGYKISRGSLPTFAVGITVQADNTTIRNVAPQFFISGINIIGGASSTTIASSVVTLNRNGIQLSDAHGVSLENLDIHSNFSRNTDLNTGTGLYINTSSNVRMRNVSISGSGENLHIAGASLASLNHDIDTSNTIEGKPIYYVQRANGIVYDENTNAAIFFCIECTNITVKNLSFQNNRTGIFLFNTNNSRIENITATKVSYGIQLLNSDANTISSNTLATSSSMFLAFGSDNNLIENNTFTGNKHAHVEISDSSPKSIGNRFVGNTFEGASKSLQGYFLNTVIENNTFSGAREEGIFMRGFAYNNVVRNNLFTNNRDALVLEGIDSSNVYQNTFASSTRSDIVLKHLPIPFHCLYNRVYNNIFLDPFVRIQNSCDASNFFSQPMPIGGNYWAAFDTPGEGCLDIDNNRVCDTAFNPTGAGMSDSLPWNVADGWRVPANRSPVLTYSDEPGYATDTLSSGVEPNRGVASTTSFVFKVVYTDADNNPPSFVRVNLDGTDSDMIVDPSSAAALRDGDYANGEQYEFSTTLTKGEHAYYFKASDGTATSRFPTSGEIKLRAGYSNLIFLPGLQATRLYSATSPTNQLWEPNFDTDVQKLFMDTSGKSVDPTIKTDGVIDEILFPAVGENIYKSFIAWANGLVADGTIHEWYPFEYDWRQDLVGVVRNPVKRRIGDYGMVQKLEELAASSDTGKVIIVAHSNGGLVAKTLVDELKLAGKENLVEQLILVAVPQIGTPKAVGALLHGEELGILKDLLLDRSTLRTFAENMLSAYNLVPHADYFVKVSDPVIEFDPSIDSLVDWRKIYGNSIDSPAELKSFLTGRGAEPPDSNFMSPNVLKTNLFDTSLATQARLDAWQAPSSMKVTQIAGWGIDTIRGLRYVARSKTVCPYTPSSTPSTTNCVEQKYLDHEPILFEDGDGTVVTQSANFLADKYFFNLKNFNRELPLGFRKNRAHSSILEPIDILNFLKNTIQNNYKTSNNIGLIRPISINSKLRLKVLSPVSIEIVDSMGNKTNQTAEEIPNSYYMPFGEGKYVGLDTNDNYTITLNGLGYGTFTFVIEEITGDTTTGSVVYSNTPVSPLTSATMSLRTLAQATPLQIDYDGSGTALSPFALVPGTETDIFKLLKLSNDLVPQIKIPLQFASTYTNKLYAAKLMIERKSYYLAREHVNYLLKYNSDLRATNRITQYQFQMMENSLIILKTAISQKI